MPLFAKRNIKPAVATSVPDPSPVAAAAGGAYYPNQIGQFYAYYSSQARNKAMSVPTISRARDLIASVAATTPLKMYKTAWNDMDEEMIEVGIAPRSWIRQPDPTIPYSTLMAWTVDDLFFSGVAYWYVTARTADGFPAAFTRLPVSMVTTDQTGPIFYGNPKWVEFAGENLNTRDVITFISPVQGIIYQSAQCIETALRLEAARYRNAKSPVPSGVLRQVAGEPMTPEALQEFVQQFAAARENGGVAGLNQFAVYEETSATPDKMMLIESANYQALECARLTNIPPYLAGISTGAYAYTNSRSAREDLFLFAAQNLTTCIAERLSMNDVLPVGTFIKFDIDRYLAQQIGEDDESETELTVNNVDTTTTNTQEDMA